VHKYFICSTNVYVLKTFISFLHQKSRHLLYMIPVKTVAFLGGGRGMKPQSLTLVE
jgi:tagatose-1,6-bisphosphate aldolase non-catalytic subunit AgaZ/GatZ